MTISAFLIRFLAMPLMLALTLTAQPAVTWAQDAIDPTERARVESIVRDYLMKNPEIILEAIRALEQREQASSEQQRGAIIANLVPTLSSSPLTPVFGADDSDVVLVEFFDYQCGYCKRMFPALQEAMEQDDKLKVIFVELPILGPASLVASRAALASREQGKYLEFHTALMLSKGRLTDEVIFQKAAETGLDVAQLKEDMTSAKVAGYLEMTRDLAGHLDVRGTPAMVVGDRFIGGFIPADQLRDAIAKARS